MEVRFHGSAAEFRALAEPLYRGDPVNHTVELTLLRAGALPDDSLLLSVWEEAAMVGAAVQTPPYPLLCNAIPVRAVDSAAVAIAEVRPALAGVRGVRETALAFADAWQESTGAAGAITVEERLYRLGELQPPTGVTGAVRAAGPDDRAVLVEWTDGFFAETFDHPREQAAGERFVDGARDNGDEFMVWTVAATPVSMALLRASAAGVARIGPVFTPLESRRRGYGSAVTAAAAGLALRRGAADVVLFADLANPTSNAIYQQIGFESVTDSIRIDFATLH